MTVKNFLEYFNLFRTAIKSIEIIQDFNTILFFSPNDLKHDNMNTFLEKCLLNSFSINSDILKIYVK